jgi:hypothetical protein
LESKQLAAFVRGELFSFSVNGLRLIWVRVTVIEPAGTSTQIDANATEADAKMDVYREARVIVGQKLTDMIENGDRPSDVAEVVLKAASAARPQLRYTVGRQAKTLRWLRTLAPVSMVDAALRKQMGLNTLVER